MRTHSSARRSKSAQKHPKARMKPSNQLLLLHRHAPRPQSSPSHLPALNRPKRQSFAAQAPRACGPGQRADGGARRAAPDLLGRAGPRVPWADGLQRAPGLRSRQSSFDSRVEGVQMVGEVEPLTRPRPSTDFTLHALHCLRKELQTRQGLSRAKPQSKAKRILFGPMLQSPGRNLNCALSCFGMLGRLTMPNSVLARACTEAWRL